jgi:hypothetical protein
VTSPNKWILVVAMLLSLLVPMTAGASTVLYPPKVIRAPKSIGGFDVARGPREKGRIVVPRLYVRGALWLKQHNAGQQRVHPLAVVRRDLAAANRAVKSATRKLDRVKERIGSTPRTAKQRLALEEAEEELKTATETQTGLERSRDGLERARQNDMAPHRADREQLTNNPQLKRFYLPKSTP